MRQSVFSFQAWPLPGLQLDVTITRSRQCAPPPPPPHPTAHTQTNKNKTKRKQNKPPSFPQGKLSFSLQGISKGTLLSFVN